MSISLVTSALSANRTLGANMSVDGWATDQDMRGAKVDLFRRYVDGDHRANLTPEMRKLLRIVDAGSLNEFNDNHIDTIVQTMSDRLRVTAIEADNPEASEWSSEVMELNRFDGLQIDVHEAAIRDGDTYVLVAWDNEAKRVTFSHEEAWDGSSGMLAIFDSAKNVHIAVKVWSETTESLADTVRVNVYYADRVEKYISRGGATLDKLEEGVYPWVMADRSPIGVPVIHFPNKKRDKLGYGQSEIENAIPLQDALNRTLYSMVMAAELTAFQVRYSIGTKFPAGITPGMAIEVYAKDGDGKPMAPDEQSIEWFKAIRIGAMEQGELVPFIEQARWLKGEMFESTSTPMPGSGGDNASGESLKQREIGLIGKVERFQVRGGNAWESVMDMAWRVQAAFGTDSPPDYARFYCRWKSAEIRNDTVVIDNALKVADKVGQREFLRLIAPVFGWDEQKIDALVAEQAAEQAGRLAAMNGPLPGFAAAANGGVSNGAVAVPDLSNGLSA